MRLARQLGEVFELELQSGRFGRRRRTAVAFGWHPPGRVEVDAGIRHAGWRVKRSQETVGEISSLFNVEVFAWLVRIVIGERRQLRKRGGKVVGRQQATKHADR